MEMPRDLTVELLKSIRNEIRNGLGEANKQIGRTNERLEKLEHGQDTLARRIVESELRTATAITELAGTVHDLTKTLRAQFDLRPRVEKCEADIRALKRRAAG